MSEDIRDFATLLQRMKQQGQDDLDTTLVCRVISFDQQKLRATVRPLARKPGPDNSAIEYPTLDNIPVGAPGLGGGFYIRPAYEAGDLVLVAISWRDVYGPLRGSVSPSAFATTIQNAVVLCGLAREGTAPDEWGEDGLLIGHKDGDAYAKFADDEVRFVFGTTEIVMDAQGIRAVVGGATFDLVEHTHTVTVPGRETTSTTPG